MDDNPFADKSVLRKMDINHFHMPTFCICQWQNLKKRFSSVKKFINSRNKVFMNKNMYIYGLTVLHFIIFSGITFSDKRNNACKKV